MNELGEKWWWTLTTRQIVGLVCYAVALILLFASLFMPFWELKGHYAIDTPVDRTSELYVLVAKIVWTGELFDGSLTFWSDALPAISLLFGSLFAIPGVFLLFLSLRSRLCCWLGRLLWSFFLFAGPWLLTISWRDDYVFRAGMLSLIFWQALIFLAHVFVAPARMPLNDLGDPPSTGTVPQH